MVETLGDSVSYYKIGHQLAFAGGLNFIRELRDMGKDIFLDMKLLDIDNTIEKGVENIVRMGVQMTTIHAYTNDQRLSDVYHEDLYRARAAAMNMIPSKTGAAAAVGLVIPALVGKFDGLSVRVPTINVSLVDLTFLAPRETTVEEINGIIEDAIKADPILAQVLHVNYEPLVSTDFNHNAYTSNFDATQTRVQGKLVKVMAWYDNEWGFSNRMLDNTIALMTAK